MEALLAQWIAAGGDTNRLHVRVTPNASRNHIMLETLEDQPPRLKIYVNTAPEDGKANKAAIKLLAKQMNLPKTAFQIHRGSKSRDKIIDII
jgi:uncharacterized protein (TIGR00251 family)